MYGEGRFTAAQITPYDLEYYSHELIDFISNLLWQLTPKLPATFLIILEIMKT
jgi:hypothetical protein